MTLLLHTFEDVTAHPVAITFSIEQHLVELWVQGHRAAMFDRKQLRACLRLPRSQLRQNDVLWTAGLDGVVLTVRPAFVSTHLSLDILSSLRTHI